VRMLARLASALRRTGRITIERPRATLWALVALTAALFAVGLAALAADNVARWTANPRGGASMVVYLGEGVDDARAHELVAELGTLPGVEAVSFVSQVESARRLQQALGADPALLEGVELASLPASVEATLAAGVRDVIAMSPTVRALRGASGVDDVVIEDSGNEQLSGAIAAVRKAAEVGALLFGLLAFVVALAAVRIRLERRESELRVVHLLGGGPSFMLVPAALAGAVLGALAAMLAAIALWSAIRIYGDAITRGLHAAFGAVDLAMPAAPLIVLFIAGGAAIGMLGGGLAGATRARA
jgi:cell division protein FtsX